MDRRELLQLTALIGTGLAPAWSRANTLSYRPVSVWSSPSRPAAAPT